MKKFLPIANKTILYYKILKEYIQNIKKFELNSQINRISDREIKLYAIVSQIIMKI